MNPDRDKCGLYWLCNLVPYKSEDLLKSSIIIEDTALKYSFEPNMAYLNASERKLHMFTLLIYDREVPNMDLQAEKCFHEMSSELSTAGYSHYRVGIGNMPSGEVSLVKELKEILDPNGIISPGRYDWSSQIQNNNLNKKSFNSTL